MSYQSAPADLVLHGARVLGMPSARRVAERYWLTEAAASEHLADFEAYGWVREVRFAGSSGWSLTDAGRAEDERRMAAELDRAGAREAVGRLHALFLPLNTRLGAACTKWQLRPSGHDPMASNDHSDLNWDAAVLDELTDLDGSLARLCARLADWLRRFDGYADRFSRALTLARAGGQSWIDGPDRDSCHVVWIQLHEDLLATLGIPRGSDTRVTS